MDGSPTKRSFWIIVALAVWFGWSMNAEVEHAKARADDAMAAVETLRHEVAELPDDDDHDDCKAEIADLDSRLDECEAQLSSIDSRVDDLESK